jgi:hypothetical protein
VYKHKQRRLKVSGQAAPLLFTKMVRIPKQEPKLSLFDKVSNFFTSSRALIFNKPKIGTKKSL